MKNRIIKKVIFLSLLLSFFILSPTLSIKSPIGTQCNSNSECESNDCENSTKKDSSGNKMSFCDCGELDLSIISGDDSQDCADAYGGVKEDWTCKDGADATWDLDYCINNNNPKDSEYPVMPLKDPSFIDHILDPTVVLSTISFEDIKPNTQISIPGLKFSKVEMTERTDPTGMQGGYIIIPYLGEYIVAIYRYSIVVAGILAIVVIIFGGLQWTISSGNAERIKAAQKKIAGSIIGLTIALLSYTLLYTINPNLIKNRSLEIKYIEGINIDEILNSQTPGDKDDWEKITAKNKISFLKNPLPHNFDFLKSLLLLKPYTAYADSSSELIALFTEITNYYKQNSGEYSKLSAKIEKNETKLLDQYIQKGACLEWETQNLYGDEARDATIKFAQYLKNLNIVSYAFGGKGAPCAISNKNKTIELACDSKLYMGSFQCTEKIKKQLENRKAANFPWDLEYCLDCSGFTHTIFKCGAKKAVESKTSLLFSCENEQLLKYQPIPQSETKPGDIVGFKANKSMGLNVGHVMICLNNGCTNIIHVHGPQAHLKKNRGGSLDEIIMKIRFEQDLKNVIKSKKAKFKYEFRRLAVLDYENIKDIPLPNCDYIKNYSMCEVNKKTECQ